MKLYTLFFSLLFIGTAQASFIIRAWDQYNAYKAYESADYNRATNVYTKMLQIDPYDPQINYNMGLVLYHQKNYELASHYFERAVAGCKNNNELKEQALFNQGNAYVEQEKLYEAMGSYAKVLELNSKNDRARHNLEYVKKLLQQQNQKDQQDNNNQQKNDSQDKQKSDSNQQQNSSKSDSQKTSKDASKNQKEQQDNHDQSQSSQQGSDSQEQKDQSGSKNKKDNDALENNKKEDMADKLEKSKESQSSQDEKSKEKSHTKKDAQSTKKDDKKEDGSLEKSQQGSSDGKNKNELPGSSDQRDELQDVYAAQIDQKPEKDERLDQRAVMVMQQLQAQEDYMQKQLLKMNVSKSGASGYGQKNW